MLEISMRDIFHLSNKRLKCSFVNCNQSRFFKNKRKTTEQTQNQKQMNRTDEEKIKPSTHSSTQFSFSVLSPNNT